jgi:hypothetical protein
MPSFCRHNRLIQNCPICTREQNLEARPLVTPGGRPEPRPRADSPSSGPGARTPTRPRGGGRSGSRMTVRQLVRETADDFRSNLVPGIKSGADAERLAEELAFAATRLIILAADPPGLYAEVADPAGDIEERTWLAFEIAWLSPTDADDPFAGVGAARRSWASGETPDLEDAQLGPRAGDVARGPRAIDAYRTWAQRTGSQAAGMQGDASWSPERRFDRVFERLGSLASMDRGPRYDLLVTLGRLGVYDLRGGALHVGGNDRVTIGAKRILGIGDPMLLGRRAIDLAEACAVPIEAVDLGFFNWERGERTTGGLPADTEPDPDLVASARAALGLD